MIAPTAMLAPGTAPDPSRRAFPTCRGSLIAEDLQPNSRQTPLLRRHARRARTFTRVGVGRQPDRRLGIAGAPNGDHVARLGALEQALCDRRGDRCVLGATIVAYPARLIPEATMSVPVAARVQT